MTVRLLAIDIGNTRVKCALFEDSKVSMTFDMRTDRGASGAAYRHALRKQLADLAPQRAAIASVVPELNEHIGDAIRREFMVLPEFVRAEDLPSEIVDYHPPASVGADRIVAAIAAHHFYGIDVDGPRPVIVVDAGTAVTFELVSAAGVYRGGAIWAGPPLIAYALDRGTSQLPPIDLILPKTLPGTDTVSSLQAGILYGFLHGVDGIVDRLRSEAAGEAFVVSTGGWGEWLSKRLDCIDAYDPLLVLQGIRLVVTGQLPSV